MCGMGLKQEALAAGQVGILDFISKIRIKVIGDGGNKKDLR